MWLGHLLENKESFFLVGAVAIYHTDKNTYPGNFEPMTIFVKNLIEIIC